MDVLVLGGTGAMGFHVCRILAERGCEVTATSRRRRSSDAAGLAYVRGSAKDPAFLEELLGCRWDAVIDFMSWGTDEFKAVYERLLGSCGQYVFLSSYRVYAEAPVITEESPRLLDVVGDAEYLATDEYALAKARCEDLLRASGRGNWTVVRPAVTYEAAVGRLQLGVYEAPQWLWRAQNGVPVPLPEGMLTKQATLTWAGDVARMIAGLVGNPAALGEVYTVSGADHLTWGQVVEAYREVLPGLEVYPCGQDELEAVWWSAYQIRYDRMYDRVVDDSKVLAATGLREPELTPMREGLVRACAQVAGKPAVFSQPGLHARLDRICGAWPLSRVLASTGPGGAAKYLLRRVAG